MRVRETARMLAMLSLSAFAPVSATGAASGVRVPPAPLARDAADDDADDYEPGPSAPQAAAAGDGGVTEVRAGAGAVSRCGAVVLS
jgi:hypothetical protein